MRRVLLDEGVPIGVRGLIVGFSVESVAEAGWAGLTNGDMIAAAESAGFEVMVTSAQNIQYQQNINRQASEKFAESAAANAAMSEGTKAKAKKTRYLELVAAVELTTALSGICSVPARLAWRS